MNGWTYLNGKRWADVTRDERYFCQHLFNLIQTPQSLPAFISFLNTNCSLDLDPHCAWEVGYEVCFFRDLWFLRKENDPIKLISPKRTFDLCLFSEQTIVIIEAKAQQGFDSDLTQLGLFEVDKQKVGKLTNTRVLLLGLASGKHTKTLNQTRVRPFDEVFTWGELAAELFKDDPVLQRAEGLYEGVKSFVANGQSMMRGKDLLAVPEAEIPRYKVGRQGGAKGVEEDIASGRWQNQSYQINKDDPTLPNRNWIELREFIRLVKAGISEQDEGGG